MEKSDFGKKKKYIKIKSIFAENRKKIKIDVKQHKVYKEQNI